MRWCRDPTCFFLKGADAKANSGALRTYHDLKMNLVRGKPRFLLATRPNTALAPASVCPNGAPLIRASIERFPCPDARELRTPAASASSHSRANPPLKAPDLQNSCP